jgi:hypothetical protein
MYVITKEESEPSTQAVVYSFNEILIINNNDYVHIYTYIYIDNSLIELENKLGC